MSPTRRVVLDHLKPTRSTIILVALALGIALIGMACSGVYAVTEAGSAEQPGGVALGMAIFYMPVVVIVLIVAAIREKRLLARALVWAVAAVLMSIGGIGVAIAMSLDPDLGMGGAAGVFVVFCAPILLVLFLPALYYALKARPAIRQDAQEAREQLAIQLVEDRGAISLIDLGQELGISPSEAGALVDDLIQAKRVNAVHYLSHKVVYNALVAAGRKAKLVGVVSTRGRVEMQELAEELNASIGLTKEWLYELVRRGRFSGYVNWDTGVLYSREAEELVDADVCPNCGGQMDLAGKGVITCGFCGAQVFI